MSAPEQRKERRLGLHNIVPKKGSKHSSVRVGRGHGSGIGGTSGTGHKGAQSRSGYSKTRDYAGGQVPMTRRTPKRGFTNVFRVEFHPINLDRLNRFPDGTEVTPAALVEAGLVDGRRPVAILGKGALERRLTVKAHKFSAAAKAAIEKKGGAAEVLPR